MMTRTEFEHWYAKQSRQPLETLKQLGYEAKPCGCGEPDCHGWIMETTTAKANAAMMRAAGLPGNLSDLLHSFLEGPVPGKSYEDMTEEERQQVREWVCSDPKVQEEQILKAFEHAGFEAAQRREAAFLTAFLGQKPD